MDQLKPQDHVSPVLFTDLPLSISSNNQYILRRVGKKTYHVPSQGYQYFKSSMQAYPFRFPQKCAESRTRIGKWIDEGNYLQINTHFYFRKDRLFTLKNKPKRLDVSNYLKSLHDCLCEILGIDDKLFFKIMATKSCHIEGSHESVSVEIFPI